MATPQSLKKRHQDILDQYTEHYQATLDLQRDLVDRLLPDLIAHLDNPDPDAVQQATAFANDTSTFLGHQPSFRFDLTSPAERSTDSPRLSRAATLFRFLRRARFAPAPALALLSATLHARLAFPPPSLSPSSNPYAQTPTFFFHPALSDRFGRPAGVLNLRDVRRAPDGSLDALKEFVRGRWEEGRRLLEAKGKGEAGEACVQMVVIVDLEGAGMANMVSTCGIETVSRADG